MKEHMGWRHSAFLKGEEGTVLKGKIAGRKSTCQSSPEKKEGKKPPLKSSGKPTRQLLPAESHEQLH